MLVKAGPVLGASAKTYPTRLPPTQRSPTRKQTNPSVGFDRNGNFYVLESQHNTGNTSGAIVLEKYDFTTGTPTPVPTSNSRAPYSFVPSNYNVLYQWVGTSDAAVYPTMLVDNNVASFTDPTTGNVQSDPYANVNTNPNPGTFSDVYVAWASIDIKPSLVTDLPNYNPNRIKLVVSSDGGNNFTGKAIASVSNGGNGGNFGTQRNSQPALVIDQNSGQVTIGWNDFGTLSTATPPLSIMMSNSVTPGLNYSYQNGGQVIIDGTTSTVPTFVQAAGSPYPADPTQLNTLVNPSGVSLGDINGDGNAPTLSTPTSSPVRWVCC